MGLMSAAGDLLHRGASLHCSVTCGAVSPLTHSDTSYHSNCHRWPLKKKCSEDIRTLYDNIFTCGEADRSRRGKWVLLLSANWSKKVKTVQTNMVAYVVWAINFKHDFRFDLQGCLEAVLASKPHFLCWSPIDGSS